MESHPCVVTTDNMGMVRHLIKSNYFHREKVQDFYSAVNLSLDINPRNNLIKALYNLQKKDAELAKDIADQVKLVIKKEICIKMEIILINFLAFGQLYG